MLDEKDKQTIQEMISLSESRMESSFDSTITEKLKEFQAQMEARFNSTITEKIKESQSQMIAYFESAILPRFDLLADGHKLLLDTMCPKSRVEELEDEIAFMKQVIKSMSRDIAELKKAQ